MTELPRLSWRLPAVVAGVLITSNLFAQPAPRPPAPPAATSGDNVRELTRGPIHEAFGQPTLFNPEPGPVVAKRPPDLINEVPPELKPEGDNTAWVPGYWAWSDDDKGHIWVSGFWRAIPPGRTWIPGYWHTTDGGYRWVSGFWAPALIEELTYLPPPPESLEAGPPVAATAENQVWIPGVWIWRESRYWWRPGFWTAANPDWVWVPDHYEWTPNGYILVGGYWDFPLFNRGLLFAPVVLTSVPAGFQFTPGVILDTRFLAAALFARPASVHYYFGDYYDPTYSQAGIYAWFAFHNSRLGYDPLFAQTSYVYSRRDPQWLPRLRETFVARRENRDARPPHTLTQFNDWVRKVDPDGTQAVAFVRPLGDVQRDRDFPVRLERLDERRRETIRVQAEQVQKFRTGRIRLEEQAARELPRTRAGGETDPKTARTGRSAPGRIRVEAPRLTQTAEGVGGRTAPSKGATGGTSGRSTTPPEPPRVPELAPSGSVTDTQPRGARPLPHPDENFAPAAGTTVPKGRLSDPVPMPKKTPPGATPPIKDPLDTVPARPTTPGTDVPPKGTPPATPPKDPGAAPREPINPRAPSITPAVPPKVDPPPATPPKKSKDG